MEHPARRGGRRKAQSSGSQPGELGACSTAAIVAGAWVTPKKKLRTEVEINVHNQAGDGNWKISADDLARTLMTNGLVLIGTGDRFKVINARSGKKVLLV
jgi:hypothetical protein